MNLQHQSDAPKAGKAPPASPVASDRIRALAVRAMEGAPALTAGEMRELAEAIIDHNGLSEA